MSRIKSIAASAKRKSIVVKYPMQKTFKATAMAYEKHNGMVLVLRALTTDEADIHDVGAMFECQAPDGITFHAFADELT